MAPTIHPLNRASSKLYWENIVEVDNLRQFQNVLIYIKLPCWMSSLKCMNELIYLLNRISSQFLICPKHTRGQLPDHTQYIPPCPAAERQWAGHIFFWMRICLKIKRCGAFFLAGTLQRYGLVVIYLLTCNFKTRAVFAIVRKFRRIAKILGALPEHEQLWLSWQRTSLFNWHKRPFLLYF